MMQRCGEPYRRAECKLIIFGERHGNVFIVVVAISREYSYSAYGVKAVV